MDHGRIAILINARNAPSTLPGCCWSFQRNALNPALLTFGIRLDHDDEPTKAAVRVMAEEMVKDGTDVRVFEGPQPVCPGAEISAMARAIDAQFYTVLNDDVVCLTYNWDSVLECWLEKHPEHPVAAWKAFPPVWTTLPDGTKQDSYPADYVIVRREWIDAADGELFRGFFPYWFEDYHLGAVVEMVTGRHNLLIPAELNGRKRSPTQRMRDFWFWLDYYKALEGERIAQARFIAKRLGVEPALNDEMLAKQRRDLDFYFSPERMNPVLEALGDIRPPSVAYQIARTNAERHMAEIAARKVAA